MTKVDNKRDACFSELESTEDFADPQMDCLSGKLGAIKHSAKKFMGSLSTLNSLTRLGATQASRNGSEDCGGLETDESTCVSPTLDKRPESLKRIGRPDSIHFEEFIVDDQDLHEYLPSLEARESKRTTIGMAKNPFQLKRLGCAALPGSGKSIRGHAFHLKPATMASLNDNESLNLNLPRMTSGKAIHRESGPGQKEVRPPSSRTIFTFAEEDQTPVFRSNLNSNRLENLFQKANCD